MININLLLNINLPFYYELTNTLIYFRKLHYTRSHRQYLNVHKYNNNTSQISIINNNNWKIKNDLPPNEYLENEIGKYVKSNNN